MQVLLVHNYFRHFGGQDAAARDDFDLLASRGVDVRMYSRRSDEIQDYGLLERAILPIKCLSSWDTAGRLEDALREFPADVAYLHNVYPLISPAIYSALARRGIPIVQTLHDFRPFCVNGTHSRGGQICEECSGGRHWNAVIHQCMHDSRLVSAVYAATMWNVERTGALDQVGVFICPSEFSRLQAIKNGIDPSKVVVRPHPIKVGGIAAGTSAGDYFLFLGRLSPEKGLWTLLRAFEQLRDVPLAIAGTGPLEEALRSHVVAKGMHHVRILGFQSGDDKWNLLRGARALVMPSEFLETFGIAATESFAAGRPVIASNIGSLGYLVRDRVTGLLFPCGDADALGARVRELAADAGLAFAMGKAARRVAEAEYTPEAAYETLMQVFERAAAFGGRAAYSSDCVAAPSGQLL